MGFYLSSLSQEIIGATITFLPQIISGILVFLLFLILYWIVGKVFDRLLLKKEQNRQNVIKFIRKSIRIFLLMFGFLTMLGTWGIDLSAIIAGLGITGFAVGFALKDALSSILAGIMVMVYKPFDVGDTIIACGAEGKVESIDLRYTTIVSDGQRDLIPNSKLVSEKVTVIR